MNPIKLFRVRDFGEIFNVSFEFFRRHFKSMYLPVIYIAGPIIILAAIAGSRMAAAPIQFDLEDPDSLSSLNFMGDFMGMYIITLLSVVISSTVLTCVVFGYFKLYHEEIEPTVGNVFEVVKSKFLGAFVLSIISFFMIMIGIMLCIFPGVYLAVPMSMVAIAFIVEDYDIGGAISRVFEVVKDNWWRSFGILIVAGILYYVIVMIFSIPAAIFGGASIMHNVQEGGDLNPENLGVGFIAMNFIATIGQYLAYPLLYTIIGFMYFGLVEQKDGKGLMDKISDIDSDYDSIEDDEDF
jgi:hypothetical protein